MEFTPAEANSEQKPTAPEDIRKLAVGYARGFMGGMLVGVPSMLTMELWWEGFFAGSGQRHQITADGTRLLEESFV
jgi:hypothetical protein